MSKCVGVLRSFGGKEVIDWSSSFVLMFFSPGERICERQQREERLLGLLRRQEPGTDNVHEVHSEINKTDFALRKHGLKRTSSAAPPSNSFLGRRDARRKFSESLGTGASLTPRTRQRISRGSENDWKFRLRSCPSWKASSLSLGVVVPTYG